MAIPFPQANNNADPGANGLYDEQIEGAVLGALLIAPDYLTELANFLTPTDFYFLRHRLIYKAILALYKANAPIERQSIRKQIDDHGDTGTLGGSGQVSMMLSELTAYVSATAYTVYYARILETMTRRRLIAKATAELQAKVSSNKISLDEALMELDELRESATIHIEDEDVVDIQEAIKKALIENDAPPEKDLQPSGLPDLDRMLGGGFRPRKLYFHGGRPGMGKTTAALHYAVQAAETFRDRGSDEVAVLVTLEMDTRDITNRILAARSGVSFMTIQNNEMDSKEVKRVYDAIAYLTELRKHLVFWNPGSVTPEQLWNKLLAIQTQRRVSVGAVFVDHMHIMSAPDKHSRDDFTKATYIADMFRHMRDRRDLATQQPKVNAAWHIFAQLNRGIEQRADKRPVMSDIRASGKIEENANAIIMYYRDSYYNDDLEDDNTLETIITKNRSGPTGTAKAAFFGETYAIKPLAREGVEPPPF